VTAVGHLRRPASRRAPRPPYRRGARTGALAVALLATLLAGCSADPPDDPTASTAPAPAPGAGSRPSPDASAPPVVTVAATSGPVTLEVAVPATSASADPVVVSPADEGATDVTLVLAGDPAVLSVASGSLERHADGTLTVLDDAGAPVGGVGAPRVTGRHGLSPDVGTGSDPDRTTAAGTPGVRVVLVDAHHAEIRLVRAGETTSAAPGTGDGVASDAPADVAGDGATATWDVVASLGTHAVRSTEWGEREGGRSLAVDATAWARAAGRAGQDLVHAQVVAAEPEAGTATMRDQLVCHAVGAPDKPTWNLEPWRPDVGLIATMAARCNPV